VRRLSSWQLSVVLLLAGMAAAQVPNSDQNGQAPQAPGGSPAAGTKSTAASQTPATAPALQPGVTITGQAPHAGKPLPKLPPDEFKNCTRREMGLADPEGNLNLNQMGTTTWLCETQVNYEEQVVIDACLNRSGNAALPRIIQACTESLDHQLVESDDRFFMVASRAEAYFAYGDAQHALDDYSAAIKLAPHNAELYYDRGVVFASQSDSDAALRDFDTAMSIDSKLLVPALLHRAKIYAARGNFSSALADYSKAISLQPKTAALWSDRGYVALSQHDYKGTVKDEAQAIQLDPKLARAYYLRAVAFGDLGDRVHAVDDLRTAVGLDASLARYVLIQGKNVTLTLPPL
jgi:tetratricopeptide (TPR) repeat protein